MKKTFKISLLITHLFGLFTIFMVFAIPYIYYRTIIKAGVTSFADFRENFSEPIIAITTIFSLLFWVVFLHLAISYILKKK